MLVEITGKLVLVEKPTERNWNNQIIKSQKILLDTYDWDKVNKVQIEINPDKINMGNAQIGDIITFKCKIESKESKNGTWFTNIKGYAISDHKQSQSQPQQPQQPQSYVQTAQPVQQPQPVQQQQVNDSDLPF